MTPQALVRRIQSRVALRLLATEESVRGPWPRQTEDGTVPGRTDFDDAWFHACAQQAEVVFDVGANVGHWALMALLCRNVELTMARNTVQRTQARVRRLVLGLVSSRITGDDSASRTLPRSAATERLAVSRMARLDPAIRRVADLML